MEKLAAQLHGALERLDLPMVVVDREGIVRWANPTAAALFGDVVGRGFSEFIAPESLRIAQESFAKKVIGGRRATHYPARVQLRNGQELAVEISSAAVEEEGEVVGVFGLFLPRADPHAQPAPADLTPRQLEVLRLLAQGESTDRMADELHISSATVRNHVRDLLKRMGVHTRLEAVLRGNELGLV